MSAPAFFYLPDGPRFQSTDLTRGPWSPDHQHAGPAAALLARAFERLAADDGMALARLTVDLLAPVPIAPLEIATTVLRAGRTVQRADATLTAGGRAIARAAALSVRVADVALPDVPDAGGAGPPPGPEASAPFEFHFFRWPVGYHSAMEARRARGVWGRGSMAMWLRPRVPLVAGEPISAVQRVMLAADSGNGVAVVLDPGRYSFVNADLAVHLLRPPEGEWVCLDAATRVETRGVGLTETRLWDARGRIGRGLQTLVVERRPER